MSDDGERQVATLLGGPRDHRGARLFSGAPVVLTRLWGYCCRSTCAGSTRVPRHAGSSAAAAATDPRAMTDAASVTGSRGPRPYTSGATNRESHNAASTPSAVPT